MFVMRDLLVLGASFVCLLGRQVLAHPTCFYDSRPPDPDEILEFCPESEDGACCNDAEEAAAIAVFQEAGELSDDCAVYYRQVACGPCDAYAGHLYERLGGDLGVEDGMTMKSEFCEEYVEACDGEIEFQTYDGQSFCEKHVGTDGEQLWSYPIDPEVVPPIGLVKAFPDLDDEKLPSKLLCMQMTPDGDEWWLSGQEGQLVKLSVEDATSTTLVLDISTGMQLLSSLEEGLLYFAFSPAFNDNNFFYASYSVGDDEGSKNRLARFTSLNSPAATKASVDILLTTSARSTSIHAAGWCGFKPSAYTKQEDNYHDLYWSNGDGGPQEDLYNRGPDLTNLHASIVRIKVPSDPDSSAYETPSDNREGGMPEICANGFRNPFRCGFDRETDDLYCGDVGQIRIEEINLIECNKDYGWGRFEGSRCQTALEERFGDCVDADRDGFEFPIYEYCHPNFDSTDPEEADYLDDKDVCGTRAALGLAVIGGNVYRGQRYNDVLEGAILFADYQTNNIYYLRDDGGEWAPGTIISDGTAKIVSFAEDNSGEVYVISSDRIPYQLPCGDLCSTTCLDHTEQIPDYESIGCFQDVVKDRALKLIKSPTCPDGEDFMSPEVCASYCATVEGAVYFGVEFAIECYCGAEGEDFSRHGELDMEQCGTLCKGSPDEFCGGDTAIEIYSFEEPDDDPLPPSPIPDFETPAPVEEEEPITPAPVYIIQFSYIGCFGDSSDSRALSGLFSESAYMTGEVCAGFCEGSEFFATQHSTECFCSAEGDDYTVYGASDNCVMSCAGDDTETCGGYYAISVYFYSDIVPTQEVTPSPAVTPMPAQPTSTSSTFVGCYVDPKDDRLLDDMTSSTSMTMEVCEEICVGNTHFGTQFSEECWCGSPTSIDRDTATCDYPCSGDSSEICGGFDIMSVYAYGDPDFVGCYEDNADRIMEFQLKDDLMSKELCATSCEGYAYYGMEYGVECFCSNTPSFESLGMASTCDFPCGGDDSQICGGFYTISVYATGVVPTIVETPSPVTVAETPAPVDVVETPAPAGDNFVLPPSYVGCFRDDETRIMSFRLGHPSMTTEMCSIACQSFTHYGTEYGTECYCGNVDFQASGDADNCDISCAGDASQQCGGLWALSVFSTEPVSLPNPIPLGCYGDDNDRVVGEMKLEDLKLTRELCAIICTDYTYYGVEWGTQCYCGNEASYDRLGEVDTCDAFCGGDSSQTCGGTWAVEVFTS